MTVTRLLLESNRKIAEGAYVDIGMAAFKGDVGRVRALRDGGPVAREPCR
jgi:hypothetical protein